MKLAPLVLVTAVLSIAACNDEPNKAAARACQESIARGRSLLAISDHEAARDWLAQAKKQCGTDAKGDIDLFAQEIDASIQRKAAAEEQRRRERAPKPPSESLVPELVALTVAYRDDKTRRTTCDQSLDEKPSVCESTRRGSVVQMNVATAVKDVTAYSVFASLPRELAECAAFGPHEMKRSWKRKDTQEYYCAITGGPLASLKVFIHQNLERPDSDVTVFTDTWTGHDTNLGARLSQAADP